MDIWNVLLLTLNQVWHTFLSNWPYLVVSVVIATLLKLYMNAEKVSSFLLRHRRAGVLLATGAAVGTPLCSCGTTAVILGMMANVMPWAPIVAFMVASPLSSPQELIYSAGLFGWPFALTFFGASVVLGLFGGWAAGLLESRGWFKNQARFLARTTTSVGNPYAKGTELVRCCAGNLPGVEPFRSERDSGVSTVQTYACKDPNGILYVAPLEKTISNAWARVLREGARTGLQLLVFFLGFAFIGYFLNNLIPLSWIPALFGSDRAYSVPLAATLGLPFYLNSEASLPLVRSLIDGGMSQGASLTFLITGAGTSVGAIAGVLTIARWRVIALVVATLWLGAIMFGLGYDILLGL
jgi:uncharacterized membrane protein YraQ (UPF0718 family)